MSNTFSNLNYHIVFSTKYRREMIHDEFRDELHRYIAGIIQENDGQPLQIGSVEDHIHILTGIPAKIAVADMLRLIKTNSAKWMNDHHRGVVKFNWQEGYAAFTVSQSQCPVVKEYILKQREHHRKMTFQEEFLDLLRKHEIQFDNQYVFDEEYIAWHLCRPYGAIIN